MQIFFSPQADTMPAPHHSVFTGQMAAFLLPNQQCQSTEGAGDSNATKTRSHPEMVSNMSRVTLNFDPSEIPFFSFLARVNTYTHTKN